MDIKLTNCGQIRLVINNIQQEARRGKVGQDVVKAFKSSGRLFIISFRTSVHLFNDLV